MIDEKEKEILWRSIDEYRRACGTPGVPSDLIIMARRSVERAVEDIIARTLDLVMNANEIDRRECGP